MPAAAVIPAPIAYTNVVAVKKLVVGCACGELVLRGGDGKPELSLIARPRGDGMGIPSRCY